MTNTRKPRQTTSVSTLVSDVSALILFADSQNRMDLLKEFSEVYSRVTQVEKEYNDLRKTVNLWQVKCGLKTEAKSLEAILAKVAETEETA